VPPIHPLMLRAVATAKKKNDRIDANKIADCLRCHSLPEAGVNYNKQSSTRSVTSANCWRQISTLVMDCARCYGCAVKRRCAWEDGKCLGVVFQCDPLLVGTCRMTHDNSCGRSDHGLTQKSPRAQALQSRN
jgi:hypothetical protein